MATNFKIPVRYVLTVPDADKAFERAVKCAHLAVTAQDKSQARNYFTMARTWWSVCNHVTTQP